MKSFQLLDRPVDLAGNKYVHPNYLQTRSKINCLVDRYLSVEILSDRLSDLPAQFAKPQPRIWELINWQAIDRNQIIGIEPELFLAVVASAAEIEAPIRDYARESWDYLQLAHPQMARFLGGTLAADGSIQELGLWEKEERQHRPALSKIYQQLTGEKLSCHPNSVDGYKSSGNLRQDVYKHAVSRMTTEWGATSVYLWLMAHSTGELQIAIAQPLQDEVNHLAKFWGIGRWAFGDSYLVRLKVITKNLFDLFKHHQGERSESNDILQISYVLHAVEIAFTLTRVLVQLYRWNQTISNAHLKQIFGEPPHQQSIGSDN